MVIGKTLLAARGWGCVGAGVGVPLLEVTPPAAVPSAPGQGWARDRQISLARALPHPGCFPSQVFKPVRSLGEHWFCSAQPGRAVSPQEGSCEGCRCQGLPDGCWAPQNPAWPSLQSAIVPGRGAGGAADVFVPWHTCPTSLGAQRAQLSGCSR